MSSFSFCSSCVRSRERRFNCDFIYFTELDFVLFRTLLRSFSLSEIQRWIVSLCDFFYVFFRSRSAISHLSTVVSIIAESLLHTISFQHVSQSIVFEGSFFLIISIPSIFFNWWIISSLQWPSLRCQNHDVVFAVVNFLDWIEFACCYGQYRRSLNQTCP
jgi:hypothetical protein